MVIFKSPPPLLVTVSETEKVTQIIDVVMHFRSVLFCYKIVWKYQTYMSWASILGEPGRQGYTPLHFSKMGGGNIISNAPPPFLVTVSESHENNGFWHAFLGPFLCFAIKLCRNICNKGLILKSHTLPSPKINPLN